MSTLLFANNANSTLAGAITNTSTTLNLAAGGGALFPNPTSGQYFVLTAIDAATGLLREIMWCTARATDTLTVLRAQESTEPLNWNPGDLIQNLWTAGQAATMLQQGQAPSSLIYYGVDTGVVNSMVATVTPSISSLNSGNIFEITPRYANTSPTVLLNISELGAQNVYRADGTNLLVGDIQPPPYKALFAWDATTTKFLLLNPCLWVSQATGSITFAGTDSGAPNAYVVTSTNPAAPAALTVGMQLRVLIGASNANSGASTLALTLLSGVNTTSIVRADGTPTQQGDIVNSEVLTLNYNGSNAWQITSLLSTNIPPRSYFEDDTAGTRSWTVPSGIYNIFVQIGGGGAGGGYGGNSVSWAAGGGGAGGETSSWINVVPGEVITYTIGGGGAGATGSGTGSNGGTTTFGPLTATGGNGGAGSNTTCAGGSPGGGTGGAGPGGNNGGWGNDGVITNNGIPTGTGGASAFGGGGRASTVTAAANAGSPSAGGGGIYANSGSPSTQVGGAGAAGTVRISW